MKYKIAIFDLDGTLLDTLQDLSISTNFALTAFGYPTRKTDEIRRFVGNGIERLIAQAVPEQTSAENCRQVLALFKEHYSVHCEDHTAPYDGIMQLLDNLIAKGIPIAVVSNKIDSAVKVLCEKYFGNRISVAIGEREGVRRKPYPDSVFEVLSYMRISPSDAVYIGDSEVDIQTAKNAATDVIAVTWGFRDRGTLSLSGATVFADSANQLESMLIWQ